jgi:hypothetical protein
MTTLYKAFQVGNAAQIERFWPRFGLNNAGVAQIVAREQGDTWVGVPRPPGPGKRWNKIVIAKACAGRGLAEHCQAMDAVAAGSLLRISPQAGAHPDYSIG